MTGIRRVQVERGDSVAHQPGWALVMEGEVSLETVEGSQRLERGDAVLVDQRTAHRLSAVQSADLVLADLRLAVPATQLPSPLVVDDFARRHPGVAALVTMCPLRAADRAWLFASSYGNLIGAAMTYSWREQVDGSAEDVDHDIATVVAAVSASPEEPWTVDRMARLVHLSRSALGDRFRRALGRSPVDVLREVRMEQARRLLAESGHPVAYVAFRVGYGSTAAFSRAFSAVHGVSPQVWRGQARGTRIEENTAPAAAANTAPATSALVTP